MINKILNNFYNVALLFILMFANSLVLTSALFLINIPISIFHLPISLILATIELKLIRNESIKTIVISLVTFILIFTVSCLLCGHVYDDSADGNGYHKFAIGLLKNGWNPIYDSQEEIIEKINLDAEENTWAERCDRSCIRFSSCRECKKTYLQGVERQHNIYWRVRSSSQQRRNRLVYK